MDLAALAVALVALLTAVSLVLAARREAEAMQAALVHVLRVLAQTNACAERTRAHAEGARTEAIATRSEMQAFRELLHEVRDETCGPVTVRPDKLRNAPAAEPYDTRNETTPQA